MKNDIEIFVKRMNGEKIEDIAKELSISSRIVSRACKRQTYSELHRFGLAFPGTCQAIIQDMLRKNSSYVAPILIEYYAHMYSHRNVIGFFEYCDGRLYDYVGDVMSESEIEQHNQKLLTTRCNWESVEEHAKKIWMKYINYVEAKINWLEITRKCYDKIGGYTTEEI